MTAVERFAQARPRLLRLAYSELGDVGEAEDVVQDAWLRLERADAEAIENLDGWLTTVVARLAVDRLRSARARRETYVGPWLPEPLVSDDPADRVARAWAALSKSVHEPIEIKLNGRLGLVLPSGDGHRAALSFVVSDGRITRIDAIRNPEKLRRL